VGNPILVLASNSARRFQLLAMGGWLFQVRPIDLDESQLPAETPGDYVIRLAKSKARTCAATTREDSIILGADTVVVDGGEVLGKPQDPDGATTMLHQLRGHCHQVYTGIALVRVSNGAIVTDLCITNVPMRAYDDNEIESYVLTGDPLDKAGAYAIQHPLFKPVVNLTGCYASVMGLPLCHLSRSLHKLDFACKTDISSQCQSVLNYTCQISSAVLNGEAIG
jgi:septum formation protein